MNTRYFDRNVCSSVLEENRKLQSMTEQLKCENRKLTKQNEQVKSYNNYLAAKVSQHNALLERSKQEAIRKANAVEQYIKNEDFIKSNLTKEKECLQMEVSELKKSFDKEKKLSRRSHQTIENYARGEISMLFEAHPSKGSVEKRVRGID